MRRTLLRNFNRRLSPCIAALLVLPAFAADDTDLKNTGQPLAVPYKCEEAELQAAGLLCTEDEPCAIFLELNGIAPLGRKLYLTGNLHATAGTLSSILLASEDGGATWKEPAPRIRAAALGQIQFYDLEHGWASGETQFPLVRDAFFLVTSDGGATWRNRPVVEDGGPGAVQKFWFDSAQHGEMFIDAGKSSPSGRYIYYESETGGQSWMIRSTGDQAPKLKHAPPVLDNPDYRIHPDAKGTAYEIQKRTGERWETMASFLIEAASCKLKAPEVQEPPPLPETDDKAEAGDKDYVEELHLGGPAAAVKKTPAKPAAKSPVKPAAKPPARPLPPKDKN